MGLHNNPLYQDIKLHISKCYYLRNKGKDICQYIY